MKGFKNFLMQGELIVIAVGLVVALAFSSLIGAFTSDIITPLVNSAGGSSGNGLGWTIDQPAHRPRRLHLGGHLLRDLRGHHLLPARRPVSRLHGQARYVGVRLAPDMKTCPRCLAVDLPAAATRCAHCTSDLPAAA